MLSPYWCCTAHQPASISTSSNTSPIALPAPATRPCKKPMGKVEQQHLHPPSHPPPPFPTPTHHHILLVARPHLPSSPLSPSSSPVPVPCPTPPPSPLPLPPTPPLVPHPPSPPAAWPPGPAGPRWRQPPRAGWGPHPAAGLGRRRQRGRRVRVCVAGGRRGAQQQQGRGVSLCMCIEAGRRGGAWAAVVHCPSPTVAPRWGGCWLWWTPSPSFPCWRPAWQLGPAAGTAAANCWEGGGGRLLLHTWGPATPHGHMHALLRGHVAVASACLWER
jgi:hypothetical protein